MDIGVDVEDSRKVVPEEELPFEALDINNFLQEEDLESIRTGQSNWRLVVCPVIDGCPVDVWVIDLPDPKHTATLLKYDDGLSETSVGDSSSCLGGLNRQD